MQFFVTFYLRNSLLRYNSIKQMFSEENPMIFQERLKKLRQKHKKTQQDVADELGITRQAYGYYESPKSKREPDQETTIKLAEMFGVTTDYLLGRTDNPHESDEPDLTDEEKALLDDPQVRMLFREMKGTPEEMRKDMLEYLQFRKQQLKKEKND